MTTKTTKADGLAELSDDELAELSATTRQRSENASRQVSRTEAQARLATMRLEVESRARDALDELLFRVRNRAAPDPPAAELVAVIEAAHGRPYLDVLADEVEASGAFVDVDDRDELRELEQAIQVEARRRAVGREIEAVREGSVRRD